MNLSKYKKHFRFMRPKEDDGSDNGGAVDRGDDFVATTDEEDAAALAAVEAEGAKAAKEAADKAAAKADEAKDETDEEKAAKAAAVDDKAKPKKDQRIPLDRHQAILDKERQQREAVELENKQLKAGQAAAQSTVEVAKLEEKVTTLETKYNQAMLDGDIKAAGEAMAEIRRTERSITEQRAAYQGEIATARAVEEVRYDTVVQRLEAAYPQIVPGNEAYDEPLVKEILELKSAFEAKGYASSTALQRAVGYVIKPASVKQEDATSVTPRVDAAAATAAARVIEQRKKNAAANNSSPPDTAAVGANGDEAGGRLDAKAAIKMPFDKFVKLGEDDLARMRGDTL